jgi:heme o synthase
MDRRQAAGYHFSDGRRDERRRAPAVPAVPVMERSGGRLIVDNPAAPTLPQPSPVAAVAASRVARGSVHAYYALTKPGITRMVLVTTAAGFYLAAAHALDVLLLLHTLIGTALAASGCSALNQAVEWRADARMPRTAGRPVPSGRLSPRSALIFSTVLSAAGLFYLLAFVNGLTAALVALSITSYIFVYTPLKRRTWHATTIGAVPGALPILAGWTAAGNAIDVHGLGLFAVLFLWQIPHFFALAWIYRDDYRAGGFRLLPWNDPDGRRLGRQAFGYAALLLPVSLAPVALGMLGTPYLMGAAALGAAFLALALGLALRRTQARAWRLFFGSIVYLPALLLLMVLDRVLA